MRRCQLPSWHLVTMEPFFFNDLSFAHTLSKWSWMTTNRNRCKTQFVSHLFAHLGATALQWITYNFVEIWELATLSIRASDSEVSVIFFCSHQGGQNGHKIFSSNTLLLFLREIASVQISMSILCNKYQLLVHFLPKKHCFWPKNTFFAQRFPKNA